MSTQDKLQDVFPIIFEFVKGEQPSATKFTGWVRQTDTAFSRIGAAIGDPWEYQSHIHPLSPERLAQTSLARFAGPSDWISPSGGCWNEAIGSDLRVFLGIHRNTWSLGFPLVKLTAPIGIQPRVTVNTTPLVFNVDFVAIQDPDGLLTTEVASPDLITTLGEFHINYYTGVITAYQPTSVTIVLEISSGQFNMFGPGVPWGTANVIPTWDQSNICNVVEVGTAGGYTTYTVTLPIVDTMTRSGGLATELTGAQELFGEGIYYDRSDVRFVTTVIGESASYRLPHALTSGFSTDDEIPEGYMYLWDEGLQRIVPLTTFKYKDENSVTVITPENALTVGTTVRILVPGTSVAEAVGYLVSVVRGNRHVGLTDGQDANTMAYTSPLSHAHLTDRFGGVLSSIEPDREKFQFRESSYPVNPHPQYMHRAGYMADDVDGNTANAMRGDLVLAQTDSDFTVGNTYEESYAIMFGGGGRTSGSGNARLAFEGSLNVSTWTSGPAHRFPFGIYATGAVPVGGVYYGALTHTPWRGLPLYLRGKYSLAETDNYAGAVLGFDLGRLAELNYIKLLQGVRDGGGDPPNAPANTGQTQWSTPLECTLHYDQGDPDPDPGLDNRLSSNQIREFRFRGIPYCSTATNTSDSIGAGSIAEFNQYFTSPGMVGADFFNVYSNAVFFSSTGDGKITSFTEHGQNWMDGSGTAPVGIYYHPQNGAEGGTFNFRVQNADGSRYEALRLGDNAGILLKSESGGITIASNSSDPAKKLLLTGLSSIELNNELGTTIDLNANTQINLTTDHASGLIYLGTLGTVNIQGATAAGIVSLGTASIQGDDVTIQSTGATEDIDITSVRWVNMNAARVIMDLSDRFMCDAVYITSTGVDRKAVYVDSTGNIGINPSAEKYKTNVRPLGDTSWIYGLEPVRYNLETDPDKTIDEYGLIAESVSKINKELCLYNKDKEVDGVAYDKMIAPLIAIVQDHKKEIDFLKAEVSRLEAELDKKSNKKTTKKK